MSIDNHTRILNPQGLRRVGDAQMTTTMFHKVLLVEDQSVRHSRMKDNVQPQSYSSVWDHFEELEFYGLKIYSS
jgi:hypothetical protein